MDRESRGGQATARRAARIACAAMVILFAAGLWAQVAQGEGGLAARAVQFLWMAALFFAGALAVRRFTGHSREGARDASSRARLVQASVSVPHLFLSLYVCLGLAALLAFPLGVGFDEREHYLRAFQVVQGAQTVANPDEAVTEGPFAIGAFLPEGSQPARYGALVEENSFLRTPERMADADLDYSAQEFVGFLNTTLYTAATYVPYYPGLLLGLLVSGNAIVAGYCAKAGAWVVFGLLLFAALQRMPFGRVEMALVCLLPSALMVWTCFSGDGMVLAASCLLLAEVCRLRTLRSRVRPVQVAYLWILVLLVALCKMAYLPVVLLVALVPAECFGSRAGRAACVVGSIVVAGVLAGAWALHGLGLLQGVSYANGASSSEQVALVLSHPLYYLRVVVSTVMTYAMTWVGDLCGGTSGLHLYSTMMGAPTAVVAACLLAAVLRRPAGGSSLAASVLDRPARAVLGCVSVLTALLVFTSLYVQFTAVGADVVSGVQARYFLPVLVPTLLVAQSLAGRVSGPADDAAWLADMRVRTGILAFYGAVLLEVASAMVQSW